MSMFVGTVVTDSGSRYEFTEFSVRRVNTRHPKRGDAGWQPLVSLIPSVPVVGEVMVITMQSMARYGADDFATPAEHVAGTTTRHTTPVLEVIA